MTPEIANQRELKLAMEAQKETRECVLCKGRGLVGVEPCNLCLSRILAAILKADTQAREECAAIGEAHAKWLREGSKTWFGQIAEACAGHIEQVVAKIRATIGGKDARTDQSEA